MKKTITKRGITRALPPETRTAAYVRVSCDKDTMLRSLAAQVSYYSEMIQKYEGWRFMGVYADEAVTGTKDSRAEFQRLLNDCRAGKIDLVITKTISRFARNTVTLLETVRELKSLGVEVYFENERIHSMSGDGELMLTILASYAQEESRSVSENCRWRIRKNFERGIPYGLSLYGYEVEGNKLTIVLEEAEVVRAIYEMYLNGMGRNAIMKQLNAQGVPAPVKRRWCESTIDGILQNEKYAGDLLLQKTYVADHLTKKKRINEGELPMYLVENNHEPIIAREEFDRVQEMRRARAVYYHPSRNTPERYPFTSKLRCGHCGHNYHRSVNGAGTKYAKMTWICHTYDKHGKAACPSKRIPESILEAVTAEAFGLPAFDADAFAAMVCEIIVPEAGRLVYVLHDGTEIKKEWRHKSRAESWSEEARQRAREKALENCKRRMEE